MAEPSAPPLFVSVAQQSVCSNGSPEGSRRRRVDDKYVDTLGPSAAPVGDGPDPEEGGQAPVPGWDEAIQRGMRAIGALTMADMARWLMAFMSVPYFSCLLYLDELLLPFVTKWPQYRRAWAERVRNQREAAGKSREASRGGIDAVAQTVTATSAENLPPVGGVTKRLFRWLFRHPWVAAGADAWLWALASPWLAGIGLYSLYWRKAIDLKRMHDPPKLIPRFAWALYRTRLHGSNEKDRAAKDGVIGLAAISSVVLLAFLYFVGPVLYNWYQVSSVPTIRSRVEFWVAHEAYPACAYFCPGGAPNATLISNGKVVERVGEQDAQAAQMAVALATALRRLRLQCLPAPVLNVNAQLLALRSATTGKVRVIANPTNVRTGHATSVYNERNVLWGMRANPMRYADYAEFDGTDLMELRGRQGGVDHFKFHQADAACVQQAHVIFNGGDVIGMHAARLLGPDDEEAKVPVRRRPTPRRARRPDAEDGDAATAAAVPALRERPEEGGGRTDAEVPASSSSFLSSIGGIVYGGTDAPPPPVDPEPSASAAATASGWGAYWRRLGAALVAQDP